MFTRTQAAICYSHRRGGLFMLISLETKLILNSNKFRIMSFCLWREKETEIKESEHGGRESLISAAVAKESV